MMLNLTKKILERKYKVFSISNGTIISFVLITSTILMPFSFLPKKAEAQSIAGYTSGIGPAIAALPQCKGVLSGGGVKGLFNGIEDLINNDEIGGPMDIDPDSLTGRGPELIPTDSLTPKSLDSTSNNLDIIVNSKTIEATTTGVSDTEVKRLLEQTNRNLKEILGSTEAINENSSCIQSIGRLIIKMMLQKLTVSTVKWINSGFDGSPAFIQDSGKFFRDIARKEIIQFGIEIQDSPFAKDWLRNQALAFNNKFQDNAEYSLNELIQQTTPEYSAITFREDFSQGGWNAWTALTQVPANNPLGAKLMFDNEIQRRLAGTSQSTAEQVHEALSQANGFLGDMRCSADNNITQSGWTDERGDPCKAIGGSWEYVTPGKMISDAATTVMGYQNNAYLNVEDLNDAVAAIADALLGQFSQNIFERGFANIGSQGSDGTLFFNNNYSLEPYKTQVEKDFIPSQLSSSWLQDNPDFDIRKDLTQALIDEQRTYSDKLALQNKELLSTTDGKEYKIDRISCPEYWTGTYPNCKGPEINTFGVNYCITMGFTGIYPNCRGPEDTESTKISNAHGLMPVIYQLDYCIPGPHPGWEDDSRETLGAKLNSLTPAEEKPVNTAGNIANGAIGVGLNFVPYIGPVLSGIFGGLTGDNDVINRDTAARCDNTNIFYNLTGYSFQCRRGVATDQVDTNMLTREGLFYVLNTVLDRYINIMNRTYFSSPDMLPEVAKEAANEFNKLSGYYRIIKDNENKILSLKTTTSILNDIKDEIDDLNTEYPEGGDEYEKKLKTQKNAFGRISLNMVTGDDVSKADDLVKQIISKKDYIYKNLLKGPYGCEAALEKPQRQFPSAGEGVKQSSNDWSNFNVNSVKRMTYPFKILYDYNDFAAGATLPDPLNINSGYKNTDKVSKTKMPSENKYDEYGPGFLSFVYFNTVNNDSNNLYAGSERLNLSGLIYNYDTHDSNWIPLGDGELNRGRGKFEKTIGIY